MKEKLATAFNMLGMQPDWVLKKKSPEIQEIQSVRKKINANNGIPYRTARFHDQTQHGGTHYE